MHCASAWIDGAELALDDRLGLPGLALGRVSPTQTIGVRPCASAALAFSATSCVALAVQRAALGVADDDVAAAELGQHRRRDLAGVGARVVAEQSCAPQRMSLPASATATSREVGKRHAHRDVGVAERRRRERRRAARRWPRGCRSSSSCRRRACVRMLACAGGCAHHASTSLPMCWLDSISACACAASAAGNTWWITGLTLAALEQRPDLLAQRRGDRGLERDRPRPQRRAGDRQALAQHQAGVDLRLGAALHRDDHDAAVLGQALDLARRRSRRRPCRARRRRPCRR